MPMHDFILLMHDDVTREPPSEMWPSYVALLRAAGVFDGGSAIGAGEPCRKAGAPGPPSTHLGGYIRIRAASLIDAKRWLAGNPVFECGGTMEVRALPRD